MLHNYKMDLLIIFAQELLLKYEAKSAKIQISLFEANTIEVKLQMLLQIRFRVGKSAGTVLPLRRRQSLS